VLLHVGITDYLNIVTDGWEGLTVTVTKPDGEQFTLGPYKTDATGGTGGMFTPDIIGTYTVQAHFPAQAYEWTTPPVFDPELFGTIMYEASDSEVLEIEVTEEQLPVYPTSSIPNEYWTRPIDAQHREWNTISGNWLEGATRGVGFVPYNDYAPDSSHILWTKDLEIGGLAGGTMGNHAFECGDAYEGKFEGSVIIAGKLFYNRFSSGFGGAMPQQGVVAVDLHTGEELWFKNNTRIAFGQTYYFDSFNYHGVFDYLWVEEGTLDFETFTFQNDWHALDPFTGEWVYTITNIPSAGAMFGASTMTRGPQGEIFIYNLDLENGWMALWNSSRVTFGDISVVDSNAGSWRPMGQIYDSARGWEWNISIPTGLPGGVVALLEDRIIGNDVSGWANIGDEPITQWCIEIETGDLMWQTTWQPPEGDVSIEYGTASIEDGAFTLQAKELRQIWAFDVDTGEELWGPTEPLPYLAIYGIISTPAYGKLIVASRMAGVIQAYDFADGSLLWTYNGVDPYNEILWSNYWPINPVFITDGKIYLGHSEHSVVDPKPRGAPFICLDAASGEVLWRVDGLFRQTDWGGSAIIGDSIIATMDTYDQRIYAIGKGPSATTVTASPTVSDLGKSIVLKGRVTDESPGTKSVALTTRFPNGVPAVHDDSMGDWMKYVYKLFDLPDVKGVTVKFEAVGPDGYYKYLGETTTDMYGNYGFTFKPEAEGQYMVIATFDGSESYWGSTSTTYLAVDPAATPTTPIEPEGASEFAISTEVAIIAAVAVAAVIGVASYWFLKRK